MTTTTYDLDLQQAHWRAVIRLGQMFSSNIPVKTEKAVFFFFPYHHLGGAERVHADIVQCLPKETSSYIFFTHKSRDKTMLAEFQQGGRCFGGWPVYKYLLPLTVGVLSGIINKHSCATVFGCNSRFFYKLLPFLSPTVTSIDLVHAFGGGSEDYSLETIPHLQKRVVINRKTREDFADQYFRRNIDPGYLDRIVLVPNAVPVPSVMQRKAHGDRLKVLYVGRGSEEKRVHLVAKAAKVCATQGVPADFVLVGDVEGAIPEADREWCTFLGEVSDGKKMAEIYRSADLLVLTSSREGFPMVIMEAMAHGVVPVTTAVGGIPEHVTHGVNGFLLRADESELSEEVADAVKRLTRQRSLLHETSENAYQYARNNFDTESFCRTYRELLGCTDL